MFIEVLVLDGNSGILHVFADLVRFNDQSILASTSVLPQQFAIAVVILGDCRLDALGQLGGLQTF